MVRRGKEGAEGLIHRVAGGVGALAIATAVIAPGAGAYPLPDSVGVTASPTTISYPANPGTTFSIDATSGAGGANFGITWRAAEVWSGPQNILSGPTMGHPLAFSQPSLVGPGTIRRIYAPVAVPVATPLAAAIRSGSCVRGSATGPGVGYFVELPPDSSTSIRIPAALTAAPYPKTDLTTSFEMTAEDDINSPRTPLLTTNLVNVGLSGVDIRMQLLHKFSFSTDLDRMPAIAGTTNPPVPRTRVSLAAIPVSTRSPAGLPLSVWKGKKTVRLGGDVTNAAGRFRIAKQSFDRNGLFRIVARIKKPPPGYVADWACGQTLDFLKPGERF